MLKGNYNTWNDEQSIASDKNISIITLDISNFPSTKQFNTNSKSKYEFSMQYYKQTLQELIEIQ